MLVNIEYFLTFHISLPLKNFRQSINLYNRLFAELVNLHQ